MTRGVAGVLTPLGLGPALFTAWWSTRRVDYFPSKLQSVFNDCEPLPGVHDRQSVMDEFSNDWYSGVLSDFQEPSLHRRPSDTPRSIRFIWIRSFHDPVVVRVDFSATGTWRLTAKQNPSGTALSSKHGIERPRQKVRVLSAAEVASLETALSTSRLFELPSSGCQRGLDGAQWIIEGADPIRGYRFRDAQSPDAGIEHDLGLFLLGLTGWDVEPIY